jgi:glycosyltransferase involved in cell wall biosynthesis
MNKLIGIIEPPQFSVIVPFYNAADHIEKCIVSLLNQTVTVYELILINDGSTDRSMCICEKYTDDSRVVLINKANGGVSSARNVGLRAANGSYVIFVDSDDFVKETMCEEYSIIISKLDCDWIVSGLQLQKSKQVNCKMPDIRLNSGLYQKEEIPQIFSSLYRGMVFNAPWSKCYKRKLIKECFDTRYSLGEDLLFNLSYLLNCSNVYFFDKPLYIYNIGNVYSLSSKYRQDGFATLRSVYAESVVLIEKIWKGKTEIDAVKQKFIADSCVMVERLVQQREISYLKKKAIFTDELIPVWNNTSFKNVKLNYGFKWKVYFFLLRTGHFRVFTYLVNIIKVIRSCFV